MRNRPMRRVSKAPIIFFAVLMFVFFCLIIFMATRKKELAEYNKVDFESINITSDSCQLYGPDGRSIKEKLMNHAPGEAVIIPEGTVILGDCFFIKSKLNGGVK